MVRRFALLLASSTLISSGFARQIESICGSNPELRKQELFLHRQAARGRRRAFASDARSETALAPSQDIGEIAVLPDDGGIVARRNLFDLDQKTLTFLPAPPLNGAYEFQVTGASYDSAAAAAGTALPLADDDTRGVPLAFSFPFFGKTYQTVFVNSDGNLTFNQGDNAGMERSLGRMAGGVPRIAPLFEDLDPTQSSSGVLVTSEANRLVVSWVQVPEFSVFGTGGVETFQVRLYPDGRIQFTYSGMHSGGAVVGIGPGGLHGQSSVVSFSTGQGSTAFTSMVAERFINADEIDIETAAQRFFETHDDSYDYIAFFNDEGIWASKGALAWEQTLRNYRTGYGDVQVDDGAEYGSAARLQSVLNMGPLSLYPASPTGIISLRAGSGYNMLKLLGHEAGHLFLAYASVPDPNDPAGQPMLGIENVHWAFNFNAEGSFMEGNQIQDNGMNAEPRFVTTAAVEQYSPLDQYLMGLRAPADVPPTFLVTGNSSSLSTAFPQVGIAFNGTRQDIQVSDIIQAQGRRTPDSTVSQRHFRMAFVLITKAGATPSGIEIAQLEAYRSEFEPFYNQATGGRASMDATLRHLLSLSVAPAAGVIAGQSGKATLSIQQPPASPVTVNLQAGTGTISVPPMVTIPAGSTTVTFSIHGLGAGVDDLTASAAGDRFETAHARIQVLPASALTVATVSGNWQTMNANGSVMQPIVMRVSDQNNLPYPGARLLAVPTGGGKVTPQAAAVDAKGQAIFQWTPTASGARLQISLAGSTQHVIINALPPTSFSASGVVNSASLLPGIAPGELMTINGTSLAGGVISQAGAPWPTELAGVSVLFNNEPAQLLSVSDSQINLIAPADLGTGAATLTVQTGSGTSAALNVTVTPVAPGIFSDPKTNFGNVMNAGTTVTTAQQPAAPGATIEIYCTGLGAVHANSAGQMVTVAQPQVSIEGMPATVLSSALVPSYGGGMYLVSAQLPQNLPAGPQNLVLTISGISSNSVKVAIQ